jgi:hypothetical protein
MTDLKGLAERVGRASHADRAIDAIIWAAIQGVELLKFECGPSGGEELSWRGDLAYPDLRGVAPYTSSIDAAMTLMPSTGEMERPLSIKLSVSESGKLYWATIENWKWGKIDSLAAKTWPIALCATALTVRAAALTE